MMEETGYTIVDWLSAGLAVCTIVISFMTYLYFKQKLKIKDLVDRLSIHDNKFHELTKKYTSLKKDYEKLKEEHTIHEVRVINAKPIGVSAKLAIPDHAQSEEFIADTKIQLAQQIGIYCMQNNYIHFEENYDPMHMAKRIFAYMSVASNNEELVKVLRPNRILDIDMDKVRELSAEFNCYRRENDGRNTSGTHDSTL